MKLLKVEIEGFKRFKEKVNLNVDGKLVSLIGANEAGKSSILQALMHMNTSKPFEDSGIHSEINASIDIQEDQEIVNCHYFLSNEDRDMLAHIPEAKNVNYYISSKNKNGENFHDIFPKIYRDASLRNAVLSLIRIASTNKKINLVDRFDSIIQEFFEKTNSTPEDLVDLDSVITILELECETLDYSDIEVLKFAKKTFFEIFDEKSPKYLLQFNDLIGDLIENENKENPSDLVLNILSKRKPKFLLFNEDDRELLHSYDLNNNKHLKDNALLNLLSSANINVHELKKNILGLNEGQVEVMMEAGNNKLKNDFKAWTQSNNYPRIVINGTTLTIQAGSIEEEEYHNIVQRSEGFRQFVALFSFIKKNEVTSSILLIDEADIHLHYDAQADFVQMLAKQSLVDKVIYTTHSIGCLPEDIGSGIRLVKYNKEKRSSEIINWFWQDNIPGFSTVLYGLGAATLAFIPVRFALFVEGPTDFIILPTLFKEVINRDYLGFMITPGISVANKEQIQIANKENPKSLFLTDSDHGEKCLYAMLLDSGVPKEHIFSLPKNRQKGLAIEDILVKETYLNAVNQVIKKYDDSNIGLSISEIPSFDRANKVKELCNKKNFPQPSKRDVVHQLIDLHAEGQPLVAKKYCNKLFELFNKIEKMFNL